MVVFSGHDGPTRHAMAEMLDIDTIAFLPGPVMSPERPMCAVVSLSGSIFVVGGCDDDADANTTEAFSL